MTSSGTEPYLAADLLTARWPRADPRETNSEPICVVNTPATGNVQSTSEARVGVRKGLLEPDVNLGNR